MKITNQTNRYLSKKSLGFTLIEILVVMAIVGTLAAIGLGVFSRLRDSSRTTSTEVFLTSLRSNMESVRSETGIPYPTSPENILSYLNDTEEFGGLDYSVKPFMPSLLKGNSNSKFVDDESDTLIDAWGEEIVFENDLDKYPGSGLYFRSTGVDIDKDEDDIEVF